METLDLATLIEVEAAKRYAQFAEKRLARFGDRRPNVRLDDSFDVVALDDGARSTIRLPAVF